MSLYYLALYLWWGILILLLIFPAIRRVQRNAQGRLDWACWSRVLGVVILLWPFVLMLTVYKMLTRTTRGSHDA